MMNENIIGSYNDSKAIQKNHAIKNSIELTSYLNSNGFGECMERQIRPMARGEVWIEVWRASNVRWWPWSLADEPIYRIIIHRDSKSAKCITLSGFVKPNHRLEVDGIISLLPKFYGKPVDVTQIEVKS